MASLLGLAMAGAEAASLPPRPTADYAIRGKTQPDGGEIVIAHSQGRLRVEVSAASAGAVVTGLLDLRTHRMTLLSGIAGMGGKAVEIDVPARYRFLDMPLNASFVGSDMVATEPCTVWRSGEEGSSRSVEVCLTDDGIPLRVRGAPGGESVGFEVTELERVTQEPALFSVPAGTEVTRIPRSMQKLIPGLMD